MSPRFHNAKKELLSAERNILRELGFEATMDGLTNSDSCHFLKKNGITYVEAVKATKFWCSEFSISRELKVFGNHVIFILFLATCLEESGCTIPSLLSHNFLLEILWNIWFWMKPAKITRLYFQGILDEFCFLCVVVFGRIVLLALHICEIQPLDSHLSDWSCPVVFGIVDRWILLTTHTGPVFLGRVCWGYVGVDHDQTPRRNICCI